MIRRDFLSRSLWSVSCRAVDFCFVEKSKGLWWYRYTVPNTRTLYLYAYYTLCLFLRSSAAGYMPANRLSRVSQWTVLCCRWDVGRCARASDIPAWQVHFLPYRPASVAWATGLWHCDTSRHTRYSSIHRASCRSVAMPVHVANDVPHARLRLRVPLAIDESLSSKHCRRSDFNREAIVVSFRLQILASVRNPWLNTQSFHVDWGRERLAYYPSSIFRAAIFGFVSC